MPLTIMKARRERGAVRIAVEAPDGRVYEREFAQPPDYTGTQVEFAQASRREMIAYVKGQMKTPNSVKLDFEGETVPD